MNNAKKGSIFAILAAVCFFVLVTYYIVDNIRWYIQVRESVDFSLGDVFSAQLVLELLAMLGMGITLLIRKKIAVVAAVGTYFVCVLFSLFKDSGFGFEWKYIAWGNICYILAYISILVMLILTIIRLPIVRKLWFVGVVAGILVFLRVFFRFQQTYDGEFLKYLSAAFRYSWSYMLFINIEIPAVIFVGFWCRNAVSTPADVALMWEPIDQPSQYQDDEFDRLFKYRELLDKGIISQEEFDAKRKSLYDK